MHIYHVVNYHITDHCNYACTYCFGKFNGQADPTVDEAKQIIDNISVYFRENRIIGGRINFAGGEPTLYPHLDELLRYTSSLGLAASVITNGSRLSAERIRSWQGAVSCIGLSIDSLDAETNRVIGRCYGCKTACESHWRALSRAIHTCGMELKVNTVVSRCNRNESLLALYRALQPTRIKLLQMHLVDGINDRAKPLAVTEEEFQAFCDRHGEFRSITVAEPCGCMENAYLMVNPAGALQLNDSGAYQTYGSLQATPMSELLASVPIHAERFRSRYDR